MIFDKEEEGHYDIKAMDKFFSRTLHPETPIYDDLKTLQSSILETEKTIITLDSLLREGEEMYKKSKHVEEEFSRIDDMTDLHILFIKRKALTKQYVTKYINYLFTQNIYTEFQKACNKYTKTSSQHLQNQILQGANEYIESELGISDLKWYLQSLKRSNPIHFISFADVIVANTVKVFIDGDLKLSNKFTVTISSEELEGYLPRFTHSIIRK